ncbi:MAG TPA: AAA family ATPase [Candidatus Paceibacterota bacterium]|nr:AAA family ATPase [Candidatus Paceibacterota bacterium]
MRLKSIELSGFKSFAKKTTLEFASSITAIVGPNGSGKSNTAESFRFVLGEQSMKSMRGRKGEDMIWNGSGAVPRAGRAGVKLVFDNTDRALNLDFDEVTIERVVYRDGANDYLLNGSQVRLRDIAELLSQANIGASGHHIISQGEADRILSSSSRERREMIEDALGLTAYLYKREEAERKLERAAENMREVEALRRELVPHLKFLASQVKKIEEAQALRENLSQLYLEYLKREHIYLAAAKGELVALQEAPAREHEELDERIEHLKRELASKGKKDARTHELIELEEEGRNLARRRDTAARELGRIEGELAAHERLSSASEGSVPAGEVRTFAARVRDELEALQSLEGDTLRARVQSLLSLARDFVRSIVDRSSSGGNDKRNLARKKSELESDMQELEAAEERVAKQVAELRTSIESEKDASREAERELFQAMAKRSELAATLAQIKNKREILSREEDAFKAEFAEAGALIGRDALTYEEYDVRAPNGERVEESEMLDEGRGKQEERHKKLERMKIKLEEIGAGDSSEVLKEHKETTERDQFLARELADITLSSEKLHQLIDELTETLETRFTEGIERINTEFDRFFKLMFGGGTAALQIVKETRQKRASLALIDDEDTGSADNDEGDNEETEEGIEIAITLPHKRIKGLHMLSGGERALTSIALIFAMSQVNPPPFLILDETDAALDEANSKRYGDMIENLSRKSQLIVITHNRETMSRAGILYGVTMGSDGISKLLSVNFEQATAVAK